eukprot:3798504-Heterocapsa_arctica.AAC.1
MAVEATLFNEVGVAAGGMSMSDFTMNTALKVDDLELAIEAQEETNDECRKVHESVMADFAK